MDLQHLQHLDTSQFVARWAKYDSAELRERLSSSTRSVLVSFADGLLSQVNKALDLLQQYLSEDVDQPDDDAGTLEPALQTLRLSALLCGETLHECHTNAPEALLTAAVQLHDHALLELGDSRPDVQDAVAKLCVSWWQLQAVDREYLVAQTLPYLLARAISSGKAGHVKACCIMRGALELLDFEDASIMDMKRMLLQAAICPAFVSRLEGRKFLACLLTVHPSMVQEMTSVIRNQVPAGRRSVLDAYGEVVLRGWREAAGPCLAEIENSLIQNLMLAAIHGSGQGLVANIRRVLGEVHRSKRLGGAGSVDSMLVRLYEPILFRALAAANAGVRRNSLQLLLDAFPLLDPEASAEEQDELLIRQFQCLSDGLTDSCPLVRVVAAQGICTVLNLYWEIIPSATTAGYVSRLTGHLAFDAALPAVRVAVLEGLQLLVDNQHAQPVLKKALPSLAPLMWDSSPRVREAMADLLLCISTSRGLHFWEVVPLDVLLEQLSNGSGGADGNVAQKLHQLLVPSYFPDSQEGAARIAALLKEHPVAGQSFCRMLVAPFINYIEGGRGSHQVQVPLEDILQLAASIMQHLLDHPPMADPSSPPRKQRNRRTAAAEDAHAAVPAPGRGSRGKRKKAPAPAAEAVGPAEDAAADEAEVDVMVVGAQEESEQTWQALLAGLTEICSGIGMALQHELCAEEDVQNLFVSDSLQQLLAACLNTAAERYVWRIAESLPCLTAVKQLLESRMQLLAAGQLIPAGLDIATAASCNDSNSSSAVDAAAVLACLAAGSTGPKLAAMLCVALNLEWSGAHCSTTVAATDAGNVQQPQDKDDVVCKACGQTEPDHNMLLCDGCDAGHHMTCLVPELTEIPEGDWFCPSCCKDIKACALARSAAIQHINLLMLSDSGRQLLQRVKLLQQVLPLLQQDAVAAEAAAMQQASRRDQLVARVVEALKSGLLYARAAVHVAAQQAEEEPLYLAHGYCSVLQQLSSSCATLRQLNCEQQSFLTASNTTQLLKQIQHLSAFLSDAWMTLKALGGLGTYIAGADAAVAAAGAVAAECGHNLLTGLVAVSRAAEEVNDDVKGVLKRNTQVLRALLTSPSAAVNHQKLSAWLLLWLEATTTTPLAAAGATVRSEMSVLVATLLGEQDSRTKTRKAAAADKVNATSGATCAVPIDDWLPKLVAAAAEAKESDEAVGAALRDDETPDDEAAQDAENHDPNVVSAEAGADGGTGRVLKSKSAVQQKRPVVNLSLPPVLEAVLHAVKRHQQTRSLLSAKCLKATISSSEQADWDSSLGALRVWCLLGDTDLSEDDAAAFRAAKQKALEDNGTRALEFSEELTKLLLTSVAAS